MPPRATLERLGRELLAEIGLKEPHVCLEHLHGFVQIEGRGWRTLGAPWPTSSREALFVLAHEIGHWVLHTEKHRGGVWWFRDGTELVMEYEAELYAHKRFRDLGVAVPRWISRVGRRRASRLIHDQLRTTSQAPDDHIARSAGVDVGKEREAEWGAAVWKMLPRVGRHAQADLLVGHIPRRPRAGTGLDILAVTPAGRSWARASGLVLIDAGCGRLRIEQMAWLRQSADEVGLSLMRF